MFRTTSPASEVVHAALAAAAPDLVKELGQLDLDIDVWRALDLDSLDHLTAMTCIADATAHDVAEHDYPRLITIRQLCSYVEQLLS